MNVLLLVTIYLINLLSRSHNGFISWWLMVTDILPLSICPLVINSNGISKAIYAFPLSPCEMISIGGAISVRGNTIKYENILTFLKHLQYVEDQKVFLQNEIPTHKIYTGPGSMILFTFHFVRVCMTGWYNLYYGNDPIVLDTIHLCQILTMHTIKYILQLTMFYKIYWGWKGKFWYLFISLLKYLNCLLLLRAIK